MFDPRSPEQMDADLVELGFITEEERISRAYARIFAHALQRRGLRRRFRFIGERAHD